MMKLKEMSLKEASQASGRSISALKVATADHSERGGWTGDRRHDFVRAISPAQSGCLDHDPDLEPRHGSLDRRNGQCAWSTVAGMGCRTHYAGAPAAAIRAAMKLFRTRDLVRGRKPGTRTLLGDSLENGDYVTPLPRSESDPCIAIAQ